MQTSVSVAFLPIYQNPYQSLLCDALAEQGVKVIFLQGLPTPQWLRFNRGKIQILHYHWLSGLYMRRFATLWGIALFLHRLRLAHNLGYKIVWTAHNIMPHKYPWLPFHAYIRRLMMYQAEIVITHCEYGRAELLRRFPRSSPVAVVPHGSYPILKPASTPDTVRAALGLSADQFVALSLGNISPYKGTDWLWHAFSEYSTARDVLVVAGRNRASKLVRHLQAETDPRLRLFPGFVDEIAMRRYFQAADVAVFAFDEILTSGSVILALSYGLPVIAPALGCLPELVTPDVGWLYPPGDRAAFGEKLRSARKANLPAMKAAARGLAAKLNWQTSAAQTAQLYYSIIDI